MPAPGPGVVNPHTGVVSNPMPANTPVTRAGTPYGSGFTWGPARPKSRKQKKSRKASRKASRKQKKSRKASRKASRKNRK